MEDEGTPPPEDARLAEVAEHLAALVERIDELALDILREAVAAGEKERPEAERRLVRARNALQRALHILGG